MNSQLSNYASGEWPRTSQALAKSIFKADLPEQYIRSIPAQSLYCVLQHNGLESSADLIEIVTKEQCQLLLDFDLWAKDSINEDNIWRWLALTDATDGLELLQKIVACLDLKVVAILIGRYVQSQIFEEPTDLPPGPEYSTPDKGTTWIAVHGLETNEEFLFKRLLALLFESNADLFYQLLAISGVTTATALEEEAYQDRQKRVQSEGIPDDELSYEAHAAYFIADALTELKSGNVHATIEDISAIQPLIYDHSIEDPLKRLLAAVPNREVCEGELSFLLNCAVVRWGVDFADATALRELLEKVKGAISLGIELLEAEKVTDLTQAYNALGLQKLYRLAFTRLIALQKKALKVLEPQLKELAATNIDMLKLIACLREPFPCLPNDQPHPENPTKPFSRLQELQDSEKKLLAVGGHHKILS